MQNNPNPMDPKIAEYLRFVSDDPLVMSDDEIHLFLEEEGFDLQAFQSRLAGDVETAIKKARLVAARDGLIHRAHESARVLSMTAEEKLREIQERLGLLGGNAAAVYNRNRAEAQDEEDLDELLWELRRLAARSDEADGKS